jgi:hypothetical protein
MAKALNIAVVVSEYTQAQGSGFAVEQYGPDTGADGLNVRRTLSRWTTRERAIAEGRAEAESLNATGFVIY